MILSQNAQPSETKRYNLFSGRFLKYLLAWRQCQKMHYHTMLHRHLMGGGTPSSTTRNAGFSRWTEILTVLQFRSIHRVNALRDPVHNLMWISIRLLKRMSSGALLNKNVWTGIKIPVVKYLSASMISPGDWPTFSHNLAKFFQKYLWVAIWILVAEEFSRHIKGSAVHKFGRGTLEVFLQTSWQAQEHDR